MKDRALSALAVSLRQKGVNMLNGRQEVAFLWHIENNSFFNYEKGEALWSPHFKPQGLEGTVWYLRLFSRGARNEHKVFISLYLRRLSNYGPEHFSLKFELSILAEDGSALSSEEYDHTFENCGYMGNVDFLKIDKSLYLRNFPRDVLSVRCKMWRGEGEVHIEAPICARTRIIVENISFRHEVDNFSTLKPNQKHTIQIPSPSKRECFVTSSLYFTVDSCRDGEMMVEITSPADSYILRKRRISLLQFGNLICCGEDDKHFDVEKKDIRKLPLSLTRQDILKKKYLPDDKLILFCECSFSTDQVYQEIGETPVEMPIDAEKQRNSQEPSKNTSKNNSNTSKYPSALEDMKSFYMNKCLTDVELKTETKSFPAHKMVPCARSPVVHRRQEILSRKSEYLPDDKLSLRYECSFSTGLELNQIEESQIEMSFAKRSDDQEPTKKDGNPLEKASQYRSVSEDIKALYINKSFTDVLVKTKSKSFPVHKLVLCVRSSVFQRMLTNDMKERNTASIEVDDLGDDVVQQLLLFLYTDTVQNLEWALATRLYYAADKYEIGRLKAVCSSFLVEHLTPATAGELLLLADTYSDGDLKKVVEDFILDHEKAVFGSKECGKS
ncbi:unnamed protein product [Larinioides sclopetarius]|uniref:Speckle-type POZ protein n=1 Tax=Larinioides sclopetarius TaxID=280406 RepID=A0AAV2BYU5_9ARAC